MSTKKLLVIGAMVVVAYLIYRKFSNADRAVPAGLRNAWGVTRNLGMQGFI
jgi:hypothetical protein